MKYLLRLALSIVLVVWLNSASATTYNFTVISNQFNPASHTVQVGDTVRWTWSNGTHTTTSTSVPAGAMEWDSPITTSNTTFLYPVTVAGTYSFFCSVHGQNMSGTFTANAVSSINDLNANAISLCTFPNPATEAVVVEFNLPTAQSIWVDATDLAGRNIELSSAAYQPAGTVRLFVPIANRGLAPGVYTLRVRGEGLQASQRVIIQ